MIKGHIALFSILWDSVAKLRLWDGPKEKFLSQRLVIML